MISIPVRAVAAQTPWRFILKSLVSLFLVAAAAVIHKEGPALALLVIFSGVTSPAIRVMTLKMNGIFDRIRVSPVSRPSVVLVYTGIWSVAAFAALIPAIIVVLYLLDPILLVPLLIGTVLAVTIGTLAGLAAKTLGDAHLYAILAAGLLIIGTLAAGPLSLLFPYSSVSMNTISLVSAITQTGFLILWLVVLVAVAERI
jgi:hypothetical protein